MNLVSLKKLSLMLAILPAMAASWKQSASVLADLTRQKNQIQGAVLRALPKTPYLGKYSYVGQNLLIKSYPVYFFNGTAATLRQDFDVSNHLSLDTTSAYAMIYVNNSLKLEARRSKSKYYSFYPVDPVAADNYQGLGSRKATDADIVLAQAAADKSKTAFFLNLSTQGNAWSIPPTVVGFYKQNKLCFLNKNSNVYESFEALVTARYGGKEQFIKALEQEELMAKEGRAAPIN